MLYDQNQSCFDGYLRLFFLELLLITWTELGLPYSVFLRSGFTKPLPGATEGKAVFPRFLSQLFCFSRSDSGLANGSKHSLFTVPFKPIHTYECLLNLLFIKRVVLKAYNIDRCCTVLKFCCTYLWPHMCILTYTHKHIYTLGRSFQFSSVSISCFCEEEVKVIILKSGKIKLHYRKLPVPSNCSVAQNYFFLQVQFEC